MRWNRVGTGGGCTALSAYLPGGYYVLFTDDNQGEPSEDADCIIGIYSNPECSEQVTYVEGTYQECHAAAQALRSLANLFQVVAV